MTDERPTPETLSPVKRALLEIRELKAKLAIAERARNGPIAIVGAGFRFPGGVTDALSFERLLWSGTDAVTEIPADRWATDLFYSADADAPGKMVTRHGGFIDSVDTFDAELFGIAPREAAHMDPQQRVLLEVAWEALENACIAPASLMGSRTGVYLGISNSDYGRALFAQRDLIDPYIATGTCFSVAAGRMSYVLGLRGPNVAVDTACSSSLVALHLACQALRLGECDAALAAGVNLILTPEINVNFSKARMMAADGRCKSFDAEADGYVRGEGCGVLVLRPLDAALANGDRILGVIRGSAINQDGRSGGLTAPNGPAQEAVIRSALEMAGIEGRAIGYLEAHGTGTKIGDPIEAGAAGAALGPGRAPGERLPMGTVKTNMGHLEAAAGMAGMIKVLLALGRSEIPPSLHFRNGNPLIDWARLPLTVPTQTMPWHPIDGRRLAGVSSFGFGGTNAHIVVEQAPTVAPANDEDASGPRIVIASARTGDSLRELAGRYAARLAGSRDVRLADVSYATTIGRTPMTHRMAFVAPSVADAAAAFESVASGAPAANVLTGTIAAGASPRVAFLFPGQGAQWAGMVRQLAASEPEVARTLAECAAALRTSVDVPLDDVLGRADLVSETQYTQPALFAVEMALAAWLRSLGIEPSIVIGHSVGEYAAACIAGVMSLEDAAQLIAARGRLMQATTRGAMTALFTDEATVAEALRGRTDRLAIAAINAPNSVVVSGDAQDLSVIVAELKARGIDNWPLNVSHAFHSPLIEPMLEEFAHIAAGVTYHAPRIPIVSNVTGKIAGREIATAEYWVRHVRQPVRFADGVAAVAASGARVFVEVGPGSNLSGLTRRTLGAEAATLITMLREGQNEAQSAASAVAQLWTSGAPVDWTAYQRNRGGRPVALPTYAFERARHWADAAMHAATHAAGSAASAGTRLTVAPPDRYVIEWPAAPLSQSGADDASKVHYLIVADDGGTGAELVREVEARGYACALTTTDIAAAIGRASPDARTLCVLHLRSLDAPSAADLTPTALHAGQERACGGVMDIVRALETHRVTNARLAVITRRARAVQAGDAVEGLASATLAGLAQVVSREYPALRCKHIDIESGDIAPLARELTTWDAEQQVAFRGGARYAARLVSDASPVAGDIAALSADATYLITGGLGGVGLDVAQSFARAGARHLTLAGRRPPDPRAREAIDAMTRDGITVRVVQADIATAAGVDAVLDGLGSSLPRLDGIVHAAGVLDDGVLSQMTWERFARVLAPKVDGAWLLHDRTQHLPLRFFAMFSSASSVLGTPGQSNYAAANAFLDALAHHRRARGLPAVSINWGPWAEVGMAAALDVSHAERAVRVGVHAIAPAAGLAALQSLLVASPAQVAVMRIDWARFATQYEADSVPAMLTTLVHIENRSAPANVADSLRDCLSRTAGAERRSLLATHVRATVAAVLGLDVSRVDVRVPLVQLGLDSLMAVETKNRIDRDAGTSAPLVHYLSGSDVEALTDILLGTLALPPSADAGLLERLPGMSENEMDVLLAKMIEEQRGQ